MRRLVLLAALVLPALGSARAASQFSVMLWTLPASAGFTRNLGTIAEAGYHHVELVGEYQHWSEAQWRDNLGVLEKLHITVDAIAGVETGFADPFGTKQFLAQLNQTIAAAHRFGSPQIILVSGKTAPGVPGAQQHAEALANLREAVPLLAAAHLTAVIEPIDRTENPSVYLDSVEEAFTFVEEVGSPNLKVLYDLYHQQRGRGNLIDNLEHHVAEVGLIHIADTPGRHAPGTGEIDYTNVYRALARLHYTGLLAMEFYPADPPADDLRRAREEAERALAAAPPAP